MTLKIISAEDILFEGEVSAVHLPGTQGAFTVLRNTPPLSRPSLQDVWNTISPAEAVRGSI